MANYKSLSSSLSERIKQEKENNSYIKVGFREQDALRRIDNPHDRSTALRTAFIRDVDKIINCPYFNRYADKTQVFSFDKNDDIAHRSLHVQLVSRIARTIGSALNLNTDLIEAIALGHDLGHTPFGHAGEHSLNNISQDKTGKFFAHNVHSVRVVDKIFPLNLTLQTLDGIATHNGEIELREYKPNYTKTFNEFDNEISQCYVNKEKLKSVIPSTLEGCVVRLSDIIAYLGKDRHDAEKNDIDISVFKDYGIGTINAEIVNNLMVNVIENSYGKNAIALDEIHFNALKNCKRENYEKIYGINTLKEENKKIDSAMEYLYKKLLFDLESANKNSPVFTHHIDYLSKPFYKREIPYIETEKHQIIIDFIASMTDDYFVDLFNYLFPQNTLNFKYKGYFD